VITNRLGIESSCVSFIGIGEGAVKTHDSRCGIVSCSRKEGLENVTDEHDSSDLLGDSRCLFSRQRGRVSNSRREELDDETDECDECKSSDL